MKRSINNKTIVKIKQHLSKGYSNSFIRELIEKEDKISLNRHNISSIKNLEMYRDVESHLNDSIVKHINIKYTEEEKHLIESVKFAICEGFDHKEIMDVYKIDPRKFADIKKLKGSFSLIAPEYNKKINETYNRKPRVNIEIKMVIAVKKLFVERNGKITFAEISSIVGLDKSHISRILSFKIYENNGQMYNSGIRKIIRSKKLESENKRKAKIKKAKERERLRLLYEEREKINHKIRSVRNQSA